QVPAQRLGVQAPALDEGGLAAEAAELGQFAQLLLQGHLEVVAGNGLVQEQALGVPGAPARQVVGVEVEDARPAAVLCRAHVSATGGGLGAEGFEDRKSTRLNSSHVK